MNSIGEACNELKKQYDDCFNSWFAEHFLKGRTNDVACSHLFKLYQQCVKVSMKEKNLDFNDVKKDLLGTNEEKKHPEEINTTKNKNTK